MNESSTAMTACYILRIRPDNSTSAAAALTTHTPGLFIARASAALHGNTGPFDKCPDNPSRCIHHMSAWYPRLSNGYALGEYGCARLEEAFALAIALGRTDVDWTQDYPDLRDTFDARPHLRTAIVRLLNTYTSPALPTDRVA
jgi:hypothetical protein